MANSSAATDSRRALCWRLFTALAILLAAGLITSSAWAQSQDPTQRLLDIQRQRQQGQAPGSGQQPNLQPAQPGAGQTAAQTGAPAPQEGDTVVESEGIASWYQNDPARSRDEAIEAAQRDAVEQASGVFITSETQMRNFDLVSDDVLSQSKGFIRGFEVVKEGRDGPFYNVTIRATVAKKAFIENFENALQALYQRVGKPRVMLVVQEFETDGAGEGFSAGQGVAALNVVEKEIRKILLREGFTFIDSRALTKGSMVEKAQVGTAADRNSILDNARTSKAELVMLGHGRIGSKGKLQAFNIVDASVGLDVIRSDNGQVMASEVVQGKGLHINAETAAVMALQKAAQDITPKIMEQVTYLWISERNNGQRIEMVVKNVNFGDILALRRALSNEVKGVSKVRQKSFSDGVALLEVESKDAPDRLAESLYQQDFGDFKLDIQDVTATTLTVQLRKR